MLSLEQSRTLHEALVDALNEVFGEDNPQNFVLLIPEQGAMISNIESPYDVATGLSGATFSILSGNHERRHQNAETGEEIKAN